MLFNYMNNCGLKYVENRLKAVLEDMNETHLKEFNHVLSSKSGQF